MSLRVFGCRKFSRLISERADRDLTPAEERYLDRHREACAECRRSEEADDCCLNLLRGCAMEAEVAPMFEDRVIRRLKVQTVREGLNYWSPAFVGAGIACIALFVALHLAASPTQVRRAETPAGEASRIGPRHVPNLALPRVPQFNQ